jgi:type VI protein secretion system component Hcp
VSDSKVFIQIPGVRGTGKGRRHTGWVEGISLSLVNGFRDIQIVKHNDSTSSKLFSFCVNGTNLEHVNFEVERNGSVVWRVELDDAMIASISTSGGDELESMTFNFGEIRHSFMTK